MGQRQATIKHDSPVKPLIIILYDIIIYFVMLCYAMLYYIICDIEEI